ncbi:hypothetical protein [Massilia cavernae]|uniref:Glycine zipper family protein n=1 Tax=Massilia cavernae TaxID=2320864 RepID=A0A418Y4X3_9BURK|nr:hypothetical protein [Massilia cavernae]RJG21181.1 hypothetical protein D3872_07230 [Massilia cavernae]
MTNEEKTRSLFRAEKRKTPRTVIGLLFGMCIGALIGWRLGNSVIGINVGMAIGATLGLCSDKVVPRRSRIAVGLFMTSVFLVAAFMKLRPVFS